MKTITTNTADVRNAATAENMNAWGIWEIPCIHSAHINQLAEAAKRYEEETPDEAEPETPEETPEEITQKLLTYFEENDDTFTDIIEQLDSWDGYLGDDRVEDMENLCEYYRDDLENFALRMYYGHDADDWTTDQWGEKHFSAFCPNRNYFYYNGYGNLISTDYKDYTDKLDKYFIDEVLENRSHLYIDDSDLDDLLDALEQARAIA